ncbi:hypothetical protein K2X33_10840 [bacterium]|nr:hypothetical protein [bacterium]
MKILLTVLVLLSGQLSATDKPANQEHAGGEVLVYGTIGGDVTTLVVFDKAASLLYSRLTDVIPDQFGWKRAQNVECQKTVRNQVPGWQCILHLNSDGTAQ